MNLRVDTTKFGDDPYFSRGYTEITTDNVNFTVALFPLNEEDTQADVDARVRKYLAADDLLAALEGLKAKYEKVCEDFVYQYCDHDADPRRDLPWAAAVDAIAKAKGESK